MSNDPLMQLNWGGMNYYDFYGIPNPTAPVTNTGSVDDYGNPRPTLISDTGTPMPTYVPDTAPGYSSPAPTPTTTSFNNSATAATTGTAAGTPSLASMDTAQVVPGPADPNQPNQINVVDYSGQIVTDPSQQFTLDDPSTPNVNESMFLHTRLPSIDPDATGTNIDPSQYTNTGFNYPTATQGDFATPTDTNTYDIERTQPNVTDMQAAQGQLSGGAIIPDNGNITIDTDDVAAGLTGTGQALKESAYQDITHVLDTSNPLERAQAQALGRFGYIDDKATVKGQLEDLQEDFVDANGDPKIPVWAQQTARNVAKIATFSGMSGSAATAAMAQALMEASIPVATADAQFFQTITLENLSNAQEATINRANVLAKMDLVNLDNRMAAAVQNSKNFLAMDLANLDNEQQARVINTEQRFQSLLEDARSENAKRLFEAESQNELDKFYAQLGQQMEMYNVGEVNDMSQFNATLENNRDQFYRDLQFNVDMANARWRQTVTLTEAQQAFEAAAIDVQNMLGVSQESLAQIWDRSDSLLDYVWKSSESEADRRLTLGIERLRANNSLTIAQLQGEIELAKNQANLDAADRAGSGQFWGSILGNLSGGIANNPGDWFGSDGILGWIL